MAQLRKCFATTVPLNSAPPAGRGGYGFSWRSHEKGDLVVIALNSANRDASQFENPDIFDITREKSQHLAFGKGIHLCLGAPLARLEGEIAINTRSAATPF